MKIMLSKPGEAERRHVVITCPLSQASDVSSILHQEVLEEGVRAVRESYRAGGLHHVRFRMAMSYLEGCMLAFPFSDTSPGLENRMKKSAIKQLDEMYCPPVSIDGINFEPWVYQVPAIARLIRRKRFLENDELGLGKTFIAGAAAVKLLETGKVKKVLCIVTNTNKYPTWAAFFDEQTDLDFTILDGTAAQRAEQIASLPDVTVVHHEALRAKYELQGYKRNPDGSIWLDEGGHRRRDKIFVPVHPGLFENEYDLIILDEYQEFRNPKAQKTIGLHHLRAKYKWAMSGTPVVNGKPEEYWSALHWLWPKLYPDYEQFCAETQIKEGGRVIGYRGLKGLKDFVDEWDTDRKVPLRCIRRRKEWIEEDLPERVDVKHILPMTTEIRTLYQEIEEDLVLRMDNGEFRNINNALTQMTRLKQVCFSPELYGGSPNSPKIIKLKDTVSELVANGEKAIIFSEWSKATRILQRELLQYNPAYIDGSVKPKKRGDEVKMFNNDEDCKLFIGTIGSCKSGISLGVATYVIFTDKDWVPANNDQAIGRSAAGGMRGRNARSRHVHVIDMQMEDSIEQYIDSILLRKSTVNNRLTERDAGARIEVVSMSDIRDLLTHQVRSADSSVVNLGEERRVRRVGSLRERYSA